ncbi:LOW QUALITY PROTEIN: myeloid-associated differentiation marker-like [Bos mutus]|uniref:LOW QUALITY PROTEIN: myeloid-associated differentiation marker-like n=1 Tax=Bos mutus TaxID=72004 RepID=UPI0006D8F57D|nr:PREDICTED: LOW QUALITY PROTEIN: myeloid-associated differentiation marker-like [Bos mutus]
MGYFFRLLQLLSTCVALSLVASENTWIADVSNWSMFTWCFCFVVTLLSLIVELCRLQENFSRSWNNFLITYTCFSALVCLSASIMYPIIHLQMLSYGTQWNHAIAATAFSCIASVAYAMETVWTCVNTSESCSFISLLKKLEITVACGILAFISNTFLYMHHLALVWCVAVYSICFILGVISLLQHRCDCDESLPLPFCVWADVFAVLLYATAAVLWPLYQFNEQLGGNPQRSRDASCNAGYSVCIWDQQLAVATLTAINLLIYVVDLVISASWI